MSERRIRGRHLTVRLSAEERAALDTAADRAGLTTGSYARQAMLGAPAPRQVRRPPIERRELARLLGELGKIGSNVNQVARELHTDAFRDRPTLDQALRDLGAMKEAVLRALGRDP